MPDLASLPLADLLVKRRSLRRQLLTQAGLHPLRIAVLSGSTPNEVVDLLELLLLEAGFAPTFHLGDYGRYAVDALHDSAALVAFAPEIVYLHTSVRNLECAPGVAAGEAEFAAAVGAEVDRYRQIWDALAAKTTAVIVQNTFEAPAQALLGNLDAQSPGGLTRFVLEVNRAFAAAARADARLLLNDVHAVAGRLGGDQWFDPGRYFSYKLTTTPAGSYALAQSLAAVVRAAYGRTRKVLVLDLDNTLWGGVIGDDGPERILIGRETPVAEAYSAFQRYCLGLRARGVLLAVASKNNDETARLGFAHPDSVLRLEHFSAFEANWQPKHESLQRMAEALSLGLDSFVFVDDNPAERALIRAQLPEVAVPEVGDDVALYPGALDAGRYFEPAALSAEDLARAAQYQANGRRLEAQGAFASYGEYLDSLEMRAEIAPFQPMYLDRIAQLTNKTNQFNLTTRRYSRAELECAVADPAVVHLYARLADRFGDNGLVSVVLGRQTGVVLALDLWLMSCRVLKRELEVALLDALVAAAQARGVETMAASYVPTKKNAMVERHYDALGFTLVGVSGDGVRSYTLALAEYRPRNVHLRLE